LFKGQEGQRSNRHQAADQDFPAEHLSPLVDESKDYDPQLVKSPKFPNHKEH
jgi:hypothetical protein